MSAFGVERGDIEKAFTKKGRERNKANRTEDARLRGKLTRGERVGAQLGGVAASAKDAPRGQRAAAARDHSAYMSRGGKHVLHRPGTTHAGARAHVREQRGVSKGLLNPKAASRGAAKAHDMIAGKYEAANRGRPGAVTPAAGTRFKPEVQRRRWRLNEARGHNAGNASFHREQAGGLRKSAFGVEGVEKAAHRRDESNTTASYSHKAEINQHARNGGVREAGSGTKVSIGNQRTLSGNGAASASSRRAFAAGVKVRRTVPPKAAAVLGAGAAVGATALHRKKAVSKSAFGVDL